MLLKWLKEHTSVVREDLGDCDLNNAIQHSEKKKKEKNCRTNSEFRVLTCQMRVCCHLLYKVLCFCGELGLKNKKQKLLLFLSGSL